MVPRIGFGPPARGVAVVSAAVCSLLLLLLLLLLMMMMLAGHRSVILLRPVGISEGAASSRGVLPPAIASLEARKMSTKLSAS